MAQIRPFAGIRYSKDHYAHLSNLIAPPYDVLDEKSKARLVASHSNNISQIDLPHLPAKTVGPDSAYAGAARLAADWLKQGILKRDTRQAFYPYAQSYQHADRTFHRRGFFALVRLSPFGQGDVIPHEKTYPDAIIDRLKLTTATRWQMSPVFGLFSDLDNKVTGRLFRDLGKPDNTATLNEVQNDLWTITDSETELAVIDMMAKKPIFIADGHHRYTMALQFQKDETQRQGGKLPPNHPANFCLFALVGMQDDGLLILPTHRIIGGMAPFDVSTLQARLGSNAKVTALDLPPEKVAEYADDLLPKRHAHTFGLYDGATKKLYEVSLVNAEVLARLEAGQSDAWRSLDVAILQRYLLDEVINPAFAPGKTLTKAYTAYGTDVVPMTDGRDRQIALLLQPTPLRALEELSRHNEVMPQKSTFFYPKLATGMVINPLD